HETRRWRYPHRLHGKRIVIHAAKRPLRRSEIAPELWERLKHLDLSFGAFLLTARLAGCYRTDETVPKSRLDYLAGDWSPGRFAWVLADVQRLAAPAPATGRQSLWSVPSELIEGDHRP